MKKNILVIPDSHLKPGAGYQRFKWLGGLISDRKPDYVVHLGDLWDFPSLSSYDIGTTRAENQRYQADLQSGWNALECLNDNIIGVDPEFFYCGGNHEARIEKVAAKNPALSTTMSMADLQVENFGWQYVPFQTPLEIQGIIFCHYLTSGVMGRPIGGENPAASLIKKTYKSCVVGHSHLLDFAERTDATGRKIMALVAGCFLEPGQREEYAGPANEMWWNGVCWLHDAEDGVFDLESISTERLKRIYG